MPFKRIAVCAGVVLCLAALLSPVVVSAHGVAKGDARFLQSLTGAAIVPLMYLGAKHMVTGYDHLLFLVGVIFFLHRLKDVVQYVSLFTVGHSITLLAGVLGGIRANPYLIDAIIGLSVVYKAFDNMDGFRRYFGFQPNPRAAVLVFGLFHGFGLATKLQEFTLPQKGLVTNIVSFNVGVEIGQLLALAAVLTALGYWRTQPGFLKHALFTNTLLMVAGFLLVGVQLQAYAQAKDDVPSAEATTDAPPLARVYNTESTTFNLGPSQGFEYKYRIEKGGGMVYAWNASGKVKSEFHGEPDGSGGQAISYDKREGDFGSGTFTAAASGIHGWFWENLTDAEVTITLTSAGFYSSGDEMRPRFDPVKHKDYIEHIPHQFPK
jgi:hypothetical protein